MNLKTPILKKFWKICEKNDAKRPIVPPDAEMDMVRDIPYIEDGKSTHMLDIYYPKGTVDKLHTIIDIHGGGLMYGTRDLNLNYNLHLAAHGFTVISIDYPLAPEVVFADQLRDIMRAYKWIFEHAEEYPQVDRDNLFLTGDSAGGLLAAYSAITNNSDELCKYYNTQKSGLNFKAIGLTCGMFKIRRGAIAWACSSTVIGKDYKKMPYLTFEEVLDLGELPPAWLLSSEQDFIKGATFYMADLLEKRGHDYELEFFHKVKEHDLPHVFTVGWPQYKESRQANQSMLDFFERHV